MLKTISRLLFITLLGACSKNGFVPPPDPCSGTLIVVNGTVSHTSGPGKTDGSIQAVATGAAGLIFSINGGTGFQSSGTFTNLAPGNYTVTAKSPAGCTATGNFTVNVGDPCLGKTITLVVTATGTDKCQPTGSIAVIASGSTGFTYKLNAGGTYQGSNVISNVNSGTQTVFVKDAGGCEQSASVNIPVLPNGPLFTNVRALITSKCGGCHMFGGNNGGATFDADCNIVALKARIKARAVDTSQMPEGAPLSAAEKKILSDWLTAGGLTSL